MKPSRQIALALLALALAGCSGEAAPSSRGVYLLLDTSGTYTHELDKAELLISALLAKLEPGELVRGRPDRHRQLHREGHRRQGHLR